MSFIKRYLFYIYPHLNSNQPHGTKLLMYQTETCKIKQFNRDSMTRNSLVSPMNSNRRE